MVYSLSSSREGHDKDKNHKRNGGWNENYSKILTTFNICMDNMQFCNGPTENLSLFISYPFAYAIGSSSYLNQLIEEIDRALVAQASKNENNQTKSDLD